MFNSQTRQQTLSTIVETGIEFKSDSIYTKYSLQEFEDLHIAYSEMQTKNSVRKKSHFIVKKKSCVIFVMAKSHH